MSTAFLTVGRDAGRCADSQKGIGRTRATSHEDLKTAQGFVQIGADHTEHICPAPDRLTDNSTQMVAFDV